MKKELFKFFSIMVTVLSIYGIWFAIEKRISLFIKNEIKIILASELNWVSEVGQVKISLAPPAIIIQNLRLTTDLPFLKAVKLDEAEARLDFLSLIGGRIEFSRLRTFGFDLNLFLEKIPESKDPIKEVNTDILFTTLKQIPIHNIFLENSTIKLSQNKYFDLDLKNLNILLQYDGQSISSIIASNIHLQNNEIVSPDLKVKIKSFLSKREFRIEELIAQTNSKTSLVFTGKTNNLNTFLKDPSGDFFYSLGIDSSEWQTVYKQFLPNAPEIAGTALLKGSGKWSNSKKNQTMNSEVQFKDLAIAGFQIGNLQSNLLWSSDKLTSDKINLIHPAGHIEISEVEINAKDNFNLETKIEIKDIELQKLFKSLKLYTIPVDLNLKSQLSCNGTILNFNLKCDGKVHGQELIVNSGMSPSSNNIIHLDQFSGSGWLNIDSHKVTYESSVEIHESIGSTQGNIDYKSGFVINYQTDSLDMKHITNLANLDFKGTTKITGKTEGDSSGATIDMLLSTTDFWFEKFGLGNIEAPLQYKKGILSIKTDNAKLLDTQYVGHINVNLNNNTLDGHFESPFLLAENIIYSLSEKVKIPVEVSGKGNAIVNFSGPFALGKMSYTLDGQLRKGTIANESFDEINFDIQSDHGEVTVYNNTLRKNKSLLTVNGSATPEGQVDLNFSGHGFNLEESFWVSKYFPTITGNYQFEMTLKNHILNPDIDYKSKITKSIL